MTHKEELGLKPAKAERHESWKHHETLKDQIRKLEQKVEGLETECKRLHRIEIDHQRFVTSNRYLRLSAFVFSAAIIVGGCLISQYGSAVDLDGKLKLGVAWGLVGAGLLIQFFFSVFDPRGSENSPQ
jgi:hypothetical protein